jgi:hypothetical protein
VRVIHPSPILDLFHTPLILACGGRDHALIFHCPSLRGIITTNILGVSIYNVNIGMFSIFHKVKGCGGFEMGLVHVHKTEFKMKSMYKNKTQSCKKHTHMA